MRIITLLSLAAIIALFSPSAQAQFGPFAAGDMLGIPPVDYPFELMESPDGSVSPDGSGGNDVDLEFTTTGATLNLIVVSAGGAPVVITPAMCSAYGEGWYYDEIVAGRDPFYPTYINRRYLLRATSLSRPTRACWGTASI